MFFRIKKIKGKEYAYIVENEWIKSKTRQKVKGYLGRAYRMKLKNNVDFFEYHKTNLPECLQRASRQILIDLIQWEVFRFGIKDGFEISTEPVFLQKKGKDSVILVNEGFMCKLTIKNLLEFKPIEHEQDTFRLARCLVEAGIQIPQELFIGLCEKLFKFEE